jgi:L,D-peptidoglycan transpeptidase YkuD (ErfK/YbiS/YcfS/YnhG family)
LSLHRTGNRNASKASHILLARVLALSPSARRGMLKLGALSFPCALGRSGCSTLKREGDGATPIGTWRVRAVRFRADQVRRPMTRLPATPIHERDGWCDAPADRNYNRPVRLPYAASAERMWRPDRLYDVAAMLGYNDRPRSRGRGSAIFLHVAGPDLAPTQGCVALALPHLLRVLARLGPRSAIAILASPRKRRPKRKLRALRARTGEVACSRKRRGPMERGPRRKRTQ